MSTVARAVLEITTDASGVDSGIASIKGKVGALATDLKGLAGTMGLAFGGAAIVSGLKTLISNTFEYADNINDLATKMGVSTDAAQRWKYAVEQSGGKIEDVDKAVNKLSLNLVGGDKSVKSALAAAGLEFSKIQNMSPEDAFNATVEAVGKIPDPMVQAKVATELFGKAGLDILPAIRDGSFKAADGVSIMSKQTIKDLADAKQSFENLGNSITIWAGGAISWVGQVGEKIGGFVNRMSIRFSEGAEGLARYDEAAADLARTQERLNAEQEKAQKAADAAAAAARAKAQADAEGEAKAKAAAEAQRRLAEAFQKQVDVLTGKQLAREVAELAKQVEVAGKQGGLTTYQYGLLHKKMVEIHAQGGVFVGRLKEMWERHEALNRVVSNSTSVYQGLLVTLKTPPPPLPLPTTSLWTGSAWKDMLNLGALPPLMETPAKSAGLVFKEQFGQALLGLGPVIVGAIQGDGKVFAAAGSYLGGFFGDQLGAALQKSISGNLGKLLGGLAGPLGSMLGGLLGGLGDKLFGAIVKSNDTKKMREQFARDMGMTLDQLYKDLQSRGESGQALANQALNVIGRKDIAAQQAWFKEVEALFAAQKKAADEAADAVDDAAERKKESVQKIKDAYEEQLSALQSRMDTLSSSIAQEAEEAEMGVTEIAEREELARLEMKKKALEEERDAELEMAEQSLESAEEKTLGSAKVIREGIEEIFRDPIKLTFEMPTITLPGGSTTRPGSGASGGGSRPSLFGSAGRLMTISDRPMNVTVISKLNNRILSRELIQVQGEVMRQIGG